MIQLAQPQQQAQLVRLWQGSPALGAHCMVEWQLLQRNPRVPYRFFVLEGVGTGPTVLLFSGLAVYLCGTPADTGELCAFLRQQGVRELQTDGWEPEQPWAKGGLRLKRELILAREPGCGLPLPRISLPPGAALEDDPEVGQVLDVLESGNPLPTEVREQLYFDLCVRRNHGLGRVLGIREGNTLAATASAFNIAPWEAYVASVQTRGDAGGRGYATRLLAEICARYADRPVTLVCRPSLLPFYARLGFADTGRHCVVATLQEEQAK